MHTLLKQETRSFKQKKFMFLPNQARHKQKNAIILGTFTVLIYITQNVKIYRKTVDSKRAVTYVSQFKDFEISQLTAAAKPGEGIF